MARMLRARARSVIAPRRVGLSTFLPISTSAWHARSRPARVRLMDDRRANPAAPLPIRLPRRQAASVGILTLRIERECSRSRQLSCFAERHPWKR